MNIELQNLGLIPYNEAFEIQKQIQQELINRDRENEVLIVCSHPPVITLGTGASQSNLLVSQQFLKEKGIDLIQSNRGGDITYHGPEQIICYPILDLRKRKQDVHWYMRSLEEVILQTLSTLGIEGFRNPGKTGVWIKSDNPLKLQKIASIGVRISRWCTMHGLAINVLDCTESFSLIHPCGLKETEIHSIEALTRSEQLPPGELFTKTTSGLQKAFKKVFSTQLVSNVKEKELCRHYGKHPIEELESLPQ